MAFYRIKDMKKAMRTPPVASPPPGAVPEPLPPPREGMDAESLETGILRHLEFTLGELPRHVDSEWEPYLSVALAVRDRLMERWIRTQDAYYENDAKRVYYLSLEFLMGRTLGNSLVNLGLLESCQRGARRTGLRLREDPRGGMGRGPRQRRPRAPRRLLPGFAGHARAALLRLRHPLRLRHLPPADRERRPGRDPRRLAALRQPVGDRAPRRPLPRPASAAACTST